MNLPAGDLDMIIPVTVTSLINHTLYRHAGAQQCADIFARRDVSIWPAAAAREIPDCFFRTIYSAFFLPE
jgi:hypothetical protein